MTCMHARGYVPPPPAADAATGGDDGLTAPLLDGGGGGSAAGGGGGDVEAALRQQAQRQAEVRRLGRCEFGMGDRVCCKGGEFMVWGLELLIPASGAATVASTGSRGRGRGRGHGDTCRATACAVTRPTAGGATGAVGLGAAFMPQAACLGRSVPPTAALAHWRTGHVRSRAPQRCNFGLHVAHEQ